MKTSHAKALQSFARDLQWLLALRLGVQLATVWFFVWGVVVLALRIFGTQNTFWLALGLFGVAPLAFLAAWRAKKQRAAFTKIRASYDRLNACGGVVMSEETADMGAWLVQLPEATTPKFRWHSGRAMSLLCVSAIFAATMLLLPERFVESPRLRQPSRLRWLRIGPVVPSRLRMFCPMPVPARFASGPDRSAFVPKPRGRRPGPGCRSHGRK